MSLKSLDTLILKQLVEASSMSAGAAEGGMTGVPLGKKEEVLQFNEDEKEDAKLKGERLTEEEEQIEEQIRKYVRNKIQNIISEHNKIKLQEEKALRKVIRSLLKESDISDMHPHRSTGINILEDLLKKMIPTLRSDYKRLTSDESQRKSFRAHIIKAIKDSLAPMQVNDQYGAPGGALLSAPEELSEELSLLDEIDIEIDDETLPGDEEKKIPIEDDDTPSEEEKFGTGLEDLDETGRNMAFACYKKVQQYILDAYDSLANQEDKKIFTDYLITNTKLYFDKFEDELLKTVEEPTTDEYEKVKSGSL